MGKKMWARGEAGGRGPAMTRQFQKSVVRGRQTLLATDIRIVGTWGNSSPKIWIQHKLAHPLTALRYTLTSTNSGSMTMAMILDASCDSLILALLQSRFKGMPRAKRTILIDLEGCLKPNALS